jgi:hypothetical protein
VRVVGLSGDHGVHGALVGGERGAGVPDHRILL